MKIIDTYMKIRTYQESDKNNVIYLWKDCGLVAPQNNPTKDIERKLKVDPDLFLVGVSNNKIIATVMGGYEGHRGWINYLAVNPVEQHKGYGKAIMKAVEILIKAKGCPKINLQVRTTNKSVLAFYESMGYSVDDVVGLGKRLKHDAIENQGALQSELIAGELSGVSERTVDDIFEATRLRHELRDSRGDS